MIGKKINQLATELAPASTDLTIIGNPTTGVSKKITLAQLGAIFSGAVSFYTNYASFPATGTTDVIFCAKDTQKLYLWSGSAYVEVFPSQALLDTYQLRSEKGNANGYASLDSPGKVPVSQLPSSIMEYKGTWSAATNTPTLANGTGDTGDVYICNAAGSVNFGAGAITFAVGDYVIYSGTIWQRSSGAVGTVTSVAITESGDALTITGSPITTSGTINIGFAGTGTQYIKGDGTLATFPSIISQAQNLITEVYNSTGATLTKGTVVYINGGQGNLPTVTKALASGDSTSAQTYGIVQADITNNNNGFVVVAGRLSDIDTQAYSVGTQLYLSSTTAGAYTSTKQYAPAHLVYVGIIVRSHPTQGIIEVKIQNGYELDELHNVAAQTPSNNDGLFYESSTSLWKNKSLSTILGGTPVTGSGNVNAIPKFTANSVLGNSNIEDDGNFVSMRGLKINAVSGVGNTINFEQGTGVNAAGIGYSTIGAASTTGFLFYIDQNTTSRSFVLDTSTILSATQLTYSLPASNGTLALVSQLTGGTVTSVGLSVPTGFAVSGSPITSSGTLVLAFDTGYSLPTIVKQNNWDTAYNARIVTASSPLSFISNTISISQANGSTSGYLSSTDWTTFNNKQSALTNPVTGTGTTNYLPKFTGTSTIGNSLVYDNGTNVGIGTTSPDNLLSVRKEASSGIATIDVRGGVSGAGVVQISGNGTTLGSTSFDLIQNSAGALIIQRDNNPISIYTNNTERMRLNASGNLSIGNTNDTYKLDVTGTGRFTGSVTIGNATAGTNVKLIFNGVASKAAGIEFHQSGTPQWYIGNGIASEDNNFELYNSNGTMAMKIIKSTNAINFQGAATFSSSVQASSVTATTSINGASVNTLGTQSTFRITSNYAGSGDIPAGTLMYLDDNTYTNLGLIPSSSGTAGSKIAAVAFNGSARRSMWEFANVSSGNPNLLLVKNGGSVGIGTTSPVTLLDVRGEVSISYNATYGLRFYNQDRNNWSFIGNSIATGDTSANLRFGDSTGEVMRITGGNVGIGTTSPINRLDVLETTSNTYGIISARGNNRGGALELYNGSTVTAAIYSLTTNDLLFYNGTGYTERMRITSGGNVGIGTSSPLSGYRITTVGTGGSIAALASGSGDANFYSSSTTIGYHFYGESSSAKFYVVNGGQIYSTSTSISAISDVRHKENIRTIETGLNEILLLKPCRFDWKEGRGTGKKDVAGFIAQDIEKILPDLVDEWKETMGATESFKSIRMTDLIPTLVKAIQELKQELDTLKNK